MKTSPRKSPWSIPALLLALTGLIPLTAHGQEQLALAGIIDTNDHSGISYTWQLHYRKPLTTRLSGSLAWINEGHVPDHHRDGGAALLWFNGPKWRERLALEFAVGPYFFFDTVPSSDLRGFEDIHGLGEILSVALTYQRQSPWSLHLNLSEIHTPGNSSTLSLLMGAGYRFGEFRRHAAQPATDIAPAPARNREIQLFGSKVISNSLDARESRAIGADYHFEFLPWAAWSATWFYRPEGQNGQHNRVATQLWLVENFSDEHLSFSAGIGGYARLGPQRVDTGDPPEKINGLFGLRAEWQWTPRTSLILTGYRRISTDDRDYDIFALGVGWRLGAT